MKPIKIVGLVIGGVVALVIIAALLILLLVNPNDFKPKIAAAVESSTGRQLNLTGDIKLSVFPWVALTLGPASLGNAPGFGTAPFLSFQRAEVRVRLLPLLAKRLEVARVVLDGLDLRLIKKPDGQANWQMNEKGRTATQQPSQPGGGPVLQSIAGIEVTHGRVSYNQYVISNLNVQTGAIESGRPVPVSLSLDADRGIAGETFDLAAKLDFQENTATKDLGIAALSVQGHVNRPGGVSLRYAIAAPRLEANLDRQTLSMPQFSMDFGAAKITGSLSGTKIVDDPHLSGTVTLAPTDLKDMATNLKVALPRTQDPKALSSLSAGAAFSYSAAGLSLDRLQIKLDDSTLSGNIHVSTAATEAIAFRLAVDRIDLDRYRPPAGSAAATPVVPAKPATSAQPASVAPAGQSAPMTADGTFTLGAAHAAGLDFTNLSVTVDMKDKVTHLHPLEAQLYGGRFSGDLTYDVRGAIPAISMDEHLSGVDVAQLLAATRAKGRVSGKANADLNATARGAGADDILKTLNGRVDANLANGALVGLDLGYELALAQALFDKQTGTSVPNTKKTSFDVFKTSAQITNGVAQTKDLTISSAVLKVTGQGTVNLPTSAIDMTLLASVMKAANRTAVEIPLKVTGTYTDPSVKPDLSALAKGELKQKAQDLLKKNGLDLNNLFKKR